MDTTGSPQGDAILALEARVTALTQIIGFLLAESPQALRHLSRLAPSLEEAASQADFSGAQLETVKATTMQILEQAERFRAATDDQA